MKNCLLAFEQLNPGSQVCHIYEAEEDYCRVTTGLVRQAISARQKVLYLFNEHSPDDLMDILGDVYHSEELHLFNAQRVCLSQGEFSPRRILKFIEHETQKALDEGFLGCRILREMSWLQHANPGLERLNLFDQLVRVFFTLSPCIDIEQYDRRQADSRLLLQAVVTSPLLILGADLLQNMYYLPADGFLTDWAPSSRLDQWLDNLVDMRRMQEEMRFTRFWVESAGDFILWVNQKGNILYANPAVCGALGSDLQDICARKYYEVDPSLSHRAWKKFWRRLKKDGKLVFQSELQTHKEVGIPVEIHANYLEYNGQEFCCAVGRDISERKRASEELRRSEEKFRLLVEGTPEYAMYTVDLEGMVTFWNAGAERLNGFTSEEILGKNFAAFYTPEEVQRSRQLYELELALQNGSHDHQGWRVCRDGSRFWASVVITPMRTLEGEPYGFTIITRNMDEQKRKEDRRSMKIASALDEY